MAYSDDINALSPDHRWAFDGNVGTDAIGTSNATMTGTLAGVALCEGVANCAQSNTIAGDRFTLPTAVDIENNTNSLKAFGGWFSIDEVSPHPCSIYSEGDAQPTYHIVLAVGNNTMFEVVDGIGDIAQAYGITMVPSRNYHLMTIFDNGTLSFYIDGVLQSSNSLVSTTLRPRTVAGEFADPAGTVGVGGSVVLLQAPTNGSYNEWASWADTTLPTPAETRSELFEKGALPESTITTDTEINMQTDLDTYASNAFANSPLCLRIEDVT